ncbi:5'-3' exonuclease [Actinomycetota bacterium]
MRLMLLDSASLYFRAFYGVPDRRESETEVPTNAVRGFLDMIATLVSTHRPTHLVACWDNDWRPAFRTEAIPTYKAHRLSDDGVNREETPPELDVQVPMIVDSLAALGISRVGVDGYEADDVMGAYAARYAGTMPIDVVTGDRDMFQLVDDAQSVRVIYTARGGVRDADLVDEAFLFGKYGVRSGAGYADMSILRGDTSDGLPGVQGIGEKTAAKLIEAYGSLAGLREAVESGDPAIKGAQRTRLEAGLDYLERAPGVVLVARDAPLPDTDITLPGEVADASLMSRLATEHGLTNSFNRVLGALGLG